jgi:hypothetical protein
LERQKAYRQKKLSEYDNEAMFQKYYEQFRAQNIPNAAAKKKAEQAVRSDKINLTKENSQIAREIDKIKELLDMDVVEYEVIDFEDIKFEMSEDGRTEIFNRPIFLWESQWEFLLDRDSPRTVIVQGVEYSLPQQMIQMQYAVNEIYSEYSEFASAVKVKMTATPDTDTLTLDFEVIPI